MQTALIITYPLLVHLAVVTDAGRLQAAAIVLLAGGLLYRGLRAGRKTAWSILAVIALLVLVSSWTSTVLYALYLPPILLPLLLLAVFGHTLLPGHVPLVTAIGEASRGPLSEEMKRYTRKVTALWTLFFFLMTLSALALPWLASPALWSLFTNVINYLLVAMLFVGEFLYRRYRFREHDHPSFAEYLRIVIKADIRKV